ncbi:hypothetical protein BLNAU_19907 [Blattamonas nauphoetae]|uniref:Uncharacterized protein n=1 Tax=Blattamonas nauphoetae TaxID=2049346 RepID=A0ABQ9X0R9_9EUKA|nr:hypothetical protein BLNAU_19907 [Blattamonas nauphoetae]
MSHLVICAAFTIFTQSLVSHNSSAPLKFSLVLNEHLQRFRTSSEQSKQGRNAQTKAHHERTVINTGGGEQHRFDIVNEDGCPKQRLDCVPNIVVNAGNVKMHDSLGESVLTISRWATIRRFENVDINVVFPLAELESRTTRHAPDLLSNAEDQTGLDAIGEVSVTSSSFSLFDSSLALGTGPLFNFGSLYGHESNSMMLLVATSLVHSRLRNISSSPSPRPSRFGWTDDRQTMIGVEVVGCTNHLYGTVCTDMNDGGSVLCQNSSFSRCSTSLEPSSTHPTYTLLHRTGEEQRFVFDSKTISSAITFTRCTFHTMSTEEDGGALEFWFHRPSVSIFECSFVKTRSSSHGGAVRFRPNSETASLVLQSSTFYHCYAGSRGGSLSLTSTGDCTVSDCHFIGTEEELSYGGIIHLTSPNGLIRLSHCLLENGIASYGGGLQLSLIYKNADIEISFCSFCRCQATYGGGIKFSDDLGRVSIKDSLFDKCSASSGGGIDISEKASFLMDRVKFRACTASSYGKDVRIDDLTMAEVEDGNMITNCISTSGADNVYFVDEKIYDSSLIPQISSIDLSSITLSASLDGDDVGGTLTVTTSENVEGRMLVVVDNSLSDYEKPNVDSPPPIARLFVFDFTTPSTTSSQSIKFNEWNTLQYESNYSISSAFLHNTDISASSSLIQTPNPPRIVKVLTDWSESEPERISFQLKGRTLSSGNYKVKLKDVSDLLISVPFTGQPTSPTESRNMHSSIVGVLLVGEASKLKSDMTYEIESVQKEGDVSPLVLDPPRLSFTTPIVRAVLDISSTLASNFTHFVVTFTGQDLPWSGTYTTLLSTSASFAVSFVRRVGTSEPIEGNATNGLLFDTTYMLSSLSSDDDQILLNKTTFSTPPGPTLSDIVCSPDSLDLSFVTLTLSGARMPSSSEYKLIVVETGGSPQLTLDISFTSSTDGSGRVEVYKKENTLKYSQSYSVVSLSLGSLLISIPNLVKFDTPTAPTRIEEATAKLNDDRTKVTIELSGTSLVDGDWTITIPTTPPQLVAGELDENGKIVCFVDVDESDSTKLKFGLRYKLKTVKLNGNEVIVNDDVIFTVPRDSFVSSASFSFVDVEHTRCQISFEGARLPSSDEYTVRLNPSFSFEMSFTSSSEGKSATLSIGTPNNLEYSSTYRIESITKTSDPNEQIRFNTSIEIVTGPKPTWTSITVNADGSAETGECGSAEDPCGSVVVGWRTGQRKVGDDGVRISIKKEVHFGERMWVGSERLLIQSASGNRSRLICESSVFGEREGKEGRDERMGIVTIGGGLVGLCDLVLSLASTSSGEVVGAFVVFGKGRFVVSSVEIVSSSLSAGGSGVVGMGVGWVSGGEMEVKSVLMRNVVLSLPLFGGVDQHDGLDFSVCELRVENTTISDALIHFSSLSPSSSFSLSNSSFMTTVRTITSAPSSSSPTNLSLISVSTSQELLSVVDCVFEKSGTCLSSSPSTLTGNALHITLCSPSRCSSTIVISRCLFVDCLSVLSGCRTLQISTGAHSAKIVLSNNWFENLASGSSWPSRKGGIAVVDWTRSGSVSASSSSPSAPVGIFVYFGTHRPTIIRRRYCSAFLNWDEDSSETVSEQAVLFRSLVATIPLQPALDVSLEAKAVKFLESVDRDDEESVDALLSSLASNSDESLTGIIQSIVVLLSSASRAITTATMKMLKTLVEKCYAKTNLTLAEADLIPQLINTLNPLSLSLSNFEDIHTCLISLIVNSCWFTCLDGLTRLEISDDYEQQAVHETVFTQVLTPSEKYIRLLCVNRFSIISEDLADEFMALLSTLVHRSPYYQPTMDFVLGLPVVLTIPSYLTFFEIDSSIWYFLDFLVTAQREWNEKGSKTRQMQNKMLQMLRMEGIDDVIEEKLLSDQDTASGELIVEESIDLSNLHGMNLSEPDL